MHILLQTSFTTLVTRVRKTVPEDIFEEEEDPGWQVSLSSLVFRGMQTETMVSGHYTPIE